MARPGGVTSSSIGVNDVVEFRAISEPWIDEAEDLVDDDDCDAVSVALLLPPVKNLEILLPSDTSGW